MIRVSHLFAHRSKRKLKDMASFDVSKAYVDNLYVIRNIPKTYNLWKLSTFFHFFRNRNKFFWHQWRTNLMANELNKIMFFSLKRYLYYFTRYNFLKKTVHFGPRISEVNFFFLISERVKLKIVIGIFLWFTFVYRFAGDTGNFSIFGTSYGYFFKRGMSCVDAGTQP